MVITCSNGNISLAKVQPVVTSEISYHSRSSLLSDQGQKIIGYDEQPQSGEFSLDMTASCEHRISQMLWHKVRKSVELEKAK